MKIRDKLYIGIVCYIISGVIVGSLIFWQFRLISSKLHVVGIVNDISNHMLEARRYEKNYLLYNSDDDVHEFVSQMNKLKDEIMMLEDEIQKQIGEENYVRLNSDIQEYKRLFLAVVENDQKQNIYLRLLSKYGSAIAKQANNLVFLFEFKSAERAFVIHKNSDSFEELKRLLQNSEMRDTASLKHYIETASKVKSLFDMERKLIDAMRIKARDVQQFTTSFTKSQKDEIDNMIMTSMVILLVAFVTALITGLIVSIRFAITVINPLLALEATTRRIAEGDFPEHIEVKGNDEIASLQRSFNTMVQRLHESMLSLDKTYRELKQKQKQLVDAEKLASVGILAAGIAHEISNPLTSVLTFSTLMLEKTPEGDPNRDKLSMMVRETVRARDIVKQLLTFAKETPISLSRQNVNTPVSEAVKILSEQGVFENIELDVQLAEGLPEIMIDSDRIMQVIINMLINATHAIVNKPGKITVLTQLSADAEAVEIVISDTGVGIAQEHLSRIFDPFFSTKQTKGTGLGLAVSYGIIKKHDGHISVTSQEGKGTTFIVRLPINAKV